MPTSSSRKRIQNAPTYSKPKIQIKNTGAYNYIPKSQLHKCYGNGVAESTSNWGFSHGISTKGNEMERIKCVIKEIHDMRDQTPSKPPLRVNCNDYTVCVKPSQPGFMNPAKRPLMTYTSTMTTIPVQTFLNSRNDMQFPTPERCYKQQNPDKIYVVNPQCCPPSCVPTYCYY